MKDEIRQTIETLEKISKEKSEEEALMEIIQILKKFSRRSHLLIISAVKGFFEVV